MFEDAGVKSPLSVHVFATSRCNQDCRHCFIKAASDSSKEYDLPAESILRAINELSESIPHVEFELEGGEILLHPQFLEIMNGLREDLLPQVTVTTNAVNPFPLNEIQMTGRAGPLRLRVSAEGHTQKVHGLLRSNSLAEVFGRVKLCANSGANIVIRTTLHSGNVQYMKEMIATFAATGANELQFLEFQTCGRGGLPENHWLAPNDKWFETAVHTFATEAIPHGIQRMSLSLSKRHKALLERLEHVLALSKCKTISRSEASLTLNWDGSLGYCPWRPFKTVLLPYWPDDLTSFVSRLLQNGGLLHDCDFCSAVTVIRNCCDEQ